MTDKPGVVEATITRPVAWQDVIPRGDDGSSWRRQSLASGATGIALLHIERAQVGIGDQSTAHAWLTAAASAGVSAADTASLFFGAPAVAFALHVAAGGQPDKYHQARASLDMRVASLVHRRVGRATDRMDRGEMARLDEFDLIYGLTGIGAHLLAHHPGGDALGRILAYLVRLTEPIRADGQTRPGWWAGHDPSFRTSATFPGGHANLGMAHGTNVILCVKSSAQVAAVRDVKAREARWPWLAAVLGSVRCASRGMRLHLQVAAGAL